MKYHTETIILIDDDGPALMRCRTNIDGDILICLYLGGPAEYLTLDVTDASTDALLELAASLRKTANDLAVAVEKRWKIAEEES